MPNHKNMGIELNDMLIQHGVTRQQGNKNVKAHDWHMCMMS